MKLKNVEDIYPLSPMQETMLFHASMQVNRRENDKQSFSNSDVLFNQVHFKVIGTLAVEKFKQCWQILLTRHQSLRSGFVFSGLKQPQQIVRKELDLPFEFVDLSVYSDVEKPSQIAAILNQDRQRGFILDKAPLMRISLVKYSENEYHFVWSTHHLVIDRWCIPILFEEFYSLYQMQSQPINSLPAAPQFKRYIAWLKSMDEKKSHDYWQTKLHGFSRPTVITKTRNETIDVNETFSSQLPKNTFELLKKQCRQRTLTLATIIKGAWSILLSQECTSNDVVFGLVVAGRPAEISGIESIVGSFVNNVPARVLLKKDLCVVDWLRGIQRDGVLQTKFEYTALRDLHQFSALEANQNLFDSILLWLAPASTNSNNGLEFQPVSANMQTAFPLTLSIEEQSEGINFLVDVSSSYELTFSASELLVRLENILQQLALITTETQLDDLTFIQETVNQAPISETQSNIVNSSEKKHSDKVGRERVDRTALIEFLTEQWKQILQLESVAQDDDFFELGGDSLKATQLLLKLEQLERKSIPILSLFQGRTIEEMTNIVLNRDWPVKPGIATAINKNGSQRPIFCIASPEVNTLGFANLAHHMGSDYPVYILQIAPNKDAIEEPEASELPEMAIEYIEGILKIQPTGPYRLIGMCSGSQIAIEMARQMEQRGLELEFFGQINTWAFYTVSKWYYLEKVFNLYRYYKQRFAGLTFSRLMQEIGSKFSLSKKTNHVNTTDKAEKVEPTHYQPQQVRDPENGYSIINDVGWVHLLPELKKISQKVTVFRLANQSFWRINDDALGWGNQALETEVVMLDGRFHMSILRESHAPQLAEKIRQCLAPTNQKSDINRQVKV